MIISKAFVPVAINNYQNLLLVKIISVAAGVLLLAILAQVKIILPWTPVPITGQTFGVAILALLWGSQLSFITFSTYLGLGFLGAPIFAGGLSGFLIGPTFGYLVGMFFSSWIMGFFSDKGWTKSFNKALLICYIGSFITLSCGAFGLTFFITGKSVWMAGVLPFLPGDLLKNILAAKIASKASRKT